MDYVLGSCKPRIIEWGMAKKEGNALGIFFRVWKLDYAQLSEWAERCWEGFAGGCCAIGDVSVLI